MKKRRILIFLFAVFCFFAACSAAPQGPASQEQSIVSQDPSASSDLESSEISSPKTESSETKESSAPGEEPSREEPEPESEPEPEPEPEPVSPIELRAREILDSMTQEEKVCQLFIITPEQLTGESPVTAAGEATRAALAENPVGGLVYFSINLISRDQTAEMLEATKSFAQYGVFLAVDEEGGLVSRVGSNPEMGTTAFPPMAQIASDEEAYQVGYTIGSELLELGFNLDFAPVADVHSNFYSTVIGERAFSSDAKTAASRVSACVRGFRESGMLCTLKHFPGHGDTIEDSHYEPAKSEKTIDLLSACEFLPFIAGIEAGAPFVMVGHIALPNVTGNSIPATLSAPIVTGILREQLGYEGLVVTDSMQMLAITENYSSGEAAFLAIEAGWDLILAPEDFPAAKETLLEKLADGSLTAQRIDESVLRILKAKLSAGILE